MSKRFVAKTLFAAEYPFEKNWLLLIAIQVSIDCGNTSDYFRHAGPYQKLRFYEHLHSFAANSMA